MSGHQSASWFAETGSSFDYDDVTAFGIAPQPSDPSQAVLLVDVEVVERGLLPSGTPFIPSLKVPKPPFLRSTCGHGLMRSVVDWNGPLVARPKTVCRSLDHPRSRVQAVRDLISRSRRRRLAASSEQATVTIRRSPEESSGNCRHSR